VERQERNEGLVPLVSWRQGLRPAPRAAVLTGRRSGHDG